MTPYTIFDYNSNSRYAYPLRSKVFTNFNVSYAMVIESNEVTGMVSLNGMVSGWKD